MGANGQAPKGHAHWIGTHSDNDGATAVVNVYGARVTDEVVTQGSGSLTVW